MSVINIMCCYNEIEYLPKVIRFYQQQDIPVYVADNHSTDGSWEWLNDHGIPCEQFDTEGCFNLEAQQRLRRRIALRHAQMEWVIYGDADEYIATQLDLKEVLSFAAKHECNVIRMKSFNLFNTGEQRQADVTRTYFHYQERYRERQGIERIHRNLPQVAYQADAILLQNKKHLNVVQGNVLNYGSTKTAEQREDVYRRRVRAWEKGLVPRVHGSHYPENSARGWVWDRAELPDMRDHEDYSFIGPRVVDF
jgi:glycosyltransferase involved in cell wall biosynthesis